MITHSRPSLEKVDIEAVMQVLHSHQLTQGPYVERFERGMAAMMGVAGGVAVNSGTTALEVTLRAMGVGPGDEVIMPSYVCSAPWLATVRVGAQPRLVDIQLDSYAIDPQKAERAVTPRTRAIIVAHLFGLPADLGALEGLGIPLIEDCAQTLGAAFKGRQVGSIGKVAVCSFYATKLLCTGEGGMVLSNDEEILERARRLREYDEKPSLEPASGNQKLTDLQAALGLSQLDRFPSFLARRRAIAAIYDQAFQQPDFLPPSIPEERTHIFYRYVVRAPELRDRAGLLSDLLCRLEHRGVQCRRPVFRPLHAYLELDGFPDSEESAKTALSIPIYPSLSDEEVANTARIVSEELCSALPKGRCRISSG